MSRRLAWLALAAFLLLGRPAEPGATERTAEAAPIELSEEDREIVAMLELLEMLELLDDLENVAALEDAP